MGRGTDDRPLAVERPMAVADRPERRVRRHVSRGGGHLGQALGHARLPARPGGAPALDDLGRQTQTDQLTRAGRTRATALVDHGAGQHRVGEFRKLPVLVGLHCVRVHALEVVAQGTARGGCGHGRWPFAC